MTKYLPIDSGLFVQNRKNFQQKMLPKSLAVFVSNDVYPTSADGHLPFHQHRDIFYLSGVDQADSILVIFPDAFEEEHREILFLTETNEHIARWEGEKLNPAQAFAVSGIQTVYPRTEFEKIFRNLLSQAEYVYLNSNEHNRASYQTQTQEERFAKWCRKTYPLHSYKRSAPMMHALRAIKNPIEIALMQEACNITEKAFKRVLSFVKPGVAEYEIEAEAVHEFIRNRSRGFAYEPIIASGANACVLHYTKNNQICQDGDLLLMDWAAEYANYASDMTRCLPVNGKFSKRQKEVYTAVLAVKNQATALLQPGIYLRDYHKQVGEIMQEELLKLGLISTDDVRTQDPKNPAYRKYFMHGTSHFLGLDVHDVGLWTEKVQAGMVFTVEPGIYIVEEGLGIRLEDNVVVQEKGAPFNLMRNIPIEIEEIEALMHGHSPQA
jgi:Xaa-Pro aminopeptidase